MTIIINIGRRVPCAWIRRTGRAVQGLMSFQENLWMIIKQSMNMAKKAANKSSEDVKYVITYDDEIEDINYKIEWMKIVVQGSEEIEIDEYDKIQRFYMPLKKYFKKEFPKDDNMKKHFKTKILTSAQVEEAYEKGYGNMEQEIQQKDGTQRKSSIADKMLEMGILTHFEWNKDFDTREVNIE